MSEQLSHSAAAAPNSSAEATLDNYAIRCSNVGPQPRLPAKHKTRIASLLGYHGFENAGDDAFCAILTDWASQLLGIDRIEISASQRKLPRMSFLNQIDTIGAEPEDRGGRIARFLREPTYLMRKDAVIFGAGSIFSSRRFWWLAVQLSVLRMLRKFGLVNTVVAGVGISIGPFKRRSDRFWCRHALRQFDVITVRDQKSWEIGGSFGLRTLIPSCDLALAMPKFFSIPQHALSRDSDAPPVIGFSVVDRDTLLGNPKIDDEKRKAMIESMTTIAQRYPGAKFRGIVFCNHPRQGDLVATEKIVTKLQSAGCTAEIVQYENDPQQLLDEIAAVDVMICNRMHSFVFSCLTQTPAVMISYASKMTEYADLLEVPVDLRFSHCDFNSNTLSPSVESLLKNPRLPCNPKTLERCSADLIVDLELAAAMMQQLSHSLRRAGNRPKARPVVRRRRLADFRVRLSSGS